MMNWDLFDSVSNMLVLASKLFGPELAKLLPMLKSLIKFKAPTEAQFKDATAAAEELKKRFDQTKEDENFFERVRSALRLDNEVYDANLSILISKLSPEEKKALRELLFAGMETAGIDGGAYILANLASRGPDFDAMKARFDEMDLALQEAKDPKKAAERLAEAWKKIEPMVSAKFNEIALEMNLAMLELETRLRQPVPLKILIFLNGFKLPSIPTTTKGKWIAGLAALAALLYLIYLFTPQR